MPLTQFQLERYPFKANDMLVGYMCVMSRLEGIAS
ncbi:hypothetical protein ThidrDRAFT_0615 [Thiorhodococcus drewsii AZ1]|uniref:Uncharacterized protein n=1 Tax=Thiorhodococcus drewsii AZ1 TaxID=765913 RepID=G2DX54_9GAMM|nr:hypothetical protein ThidrDRAFT_0615 [Thiorhodococcus drewsii AZ1]